MAYAFSSLTEREFSSKDLDDAANMNTELFQKEEEHMQKDQQHLYFTLSCLAMSFLDLGILSIVDKNFEG